MLHEIKQGLVKTREHSGFATIGIDTWGVDFGLLDRGGHLLQNPVHYRDLRTEGVPEQVFERLPREQIYQETGIQTMPINTLFQLYALLSQRPDLKDRVSNVLFMPDLFNYFLCGIARTEYTVASTSGMLSSSRGSWSQQVVDTIGIPAHWFPPLIEAGSILGELAVDVQRELSLPPARVIAVASHDTASAVIGVPAQPDENSLFLSSGTWSIIGVERTLPVITARSGHLNFSNEGGYGRTTRLLKNIMGLWLIQETRRQWQREGAHVSYSEMEQAAHRSEPFRSLVDPDDPTFAAVGDMPARIRSFCRETGQPIPRGIGEIVRCVYESLALKYRQVVREVEDVVDHEFSCLRVVGGGVQNKMLTQFTANAIGYPVLAGPVEATAMGNIAVQFLATEVFDCLVEARAAIRASFDCATYTPNPIEQAAWEQAAGQFEQIMQVRSGG